MVEINKELYVENNVVCDKLFFEITEYRPYSNNWIAHTSTEIDRDEAIKLVNTIMSAFDINNKDINNAN